MTELHDLLELATDEIKGTDLTRAALASAGRPG